MIRPLVSLTVAVIALATGCGGTDHPGLLNTTCSEFMAADDEKQMKVAAQWGNPAKDGSMTDQSKFMALGVRAGIGRYCGESGHGNEKIGDLEIAGS